nr:hypothetical protein B0A51_00902 [Rachicladosporium sp. CCFEE 5018]
MAHSDPDGESTGSSFTAASDMEDTLSTEGYSVKEYWVGRIHIRCVLAAGLAKDAKAGQEPHELDSELNLAIETYNYADKLITFRNLLPRSLWRDGRDDREELLKTIGAVLRFYERDAGELVLRNLWQRSDGRGPQNPIDAARAKHRPTNYKVDDAPSGSDVQALKEHADSLGSPYIHEEARIFGG